MAISQCFRTTRFLLVVLGGSLSILGCSLGSSVVLDLDLCSLMLLVIPGGTRIWISALSDRRCSRSLTKTLGSLSISPVALGSLSISLVADLSQISLVVSDILISSILSFFGHDPCSRLSFSGCFFFVSAGSVWFTPILAGSCRYRSGSGQFSSISGRYKADSENY